MPVHQLNRYWIPSWDINKRVLTQHLQCYLGPSATVRPYTHNGEDGFLITTAGACLTDEQVDDICMKSKEVWEKQVAAKLLLMSGKPLKRPLHQPVLLSHSASADLRQLAINRKRPTRKRATRREKPSPARS
ncbi:hypothetical protein Micbo1qcDRAFT_234208 [Microdochium bolleyi]|uniref:Uncharacterized protein n=1 Tax=Microdochium bolleyi TaxID=196109 RepID=A0A136J172_9PEZI|nr:hypothetical protein Micbo1qcDRAFT_234208 [Microdochium bolleyi]